jgi:glyoxylase-like metal-dependent hydrolase (beta-lactamase superfamily II)
MIADLDTPIEGLHASAPQPLPFAPDLHVRAFLLAREHGNLLVYSASTVDGAAFKAVGGVARHYLNHRHEAMFAPAERLAAPLFVHEHERRSVSRTLQVRATFSRRHTLDDDFEVIPTPGHTRGATAYLWDSGQHRFLFTGDTLYLSDGEWVAAVLESSDRAAYLASLDLIRGLEFDVLVPWAATGGQPFRAMTHPADARRRLDAVIARVRQGGDR